MGASQKYWFNGTPYGGEGTNSSGGQKYWFNGIPVIFLSGPTSLTLQVVDTISVTEDAKDVVTPLIAKLDEII